MNEVPGASANKPELDYQSQGNLRLPRRRSNRDLHDNAVYLASIRDQIKHVSPWLTSTCRILDFGCGQGRFLNGLLHEEIGFGEYVGIDVDPNSISWCCRNLSYKGINCCFFWYNYANDRYNSNGSNTFYLPLKEDEFDLIFCNSVYTHLDRQDIKIISKGLFALLRPGGTFYVTAFVERGVEDFVVNPAGYLCSKGEDDTPLHWVRYDFGYFVSCLKSVGFDLIRPNSLEKNKIDRSGQHWLLFQKPS